MHKAKIYIDTSVIGGCFDEEFSIWSNKLFKEFAEDKKIAVISEIVLKEISSAPDYVKNKIDEIPERNLLIVTVNKEIESLADSYVEQKIVSANFYDDALHIAIATYHNIDLLVSWNFKHIVNYNRIVKYNAINLLQGFKPLEIRNPKEVLSYEEDI